MSAPNRIRFTREQCYAMMDVGILIVRSTL